MTDYDWAALLFSALSGIGYPRLGFVGFAGWLVVTIVSRHHA